MGTCFYTKAASPILVGKTSTAGSYCWKCNRTLCKGGDSAIHLIGADWHQECPTCGASYCAEQNPKGSRLEKGGISGCFSFTWAMKPKELDRYKEFEDEYGNQLTFEQMEEIVEKCPIHFYELIGRTFS